MVSYEGSKDLLLNLLTWLLVGLRSSLAICSWYWFLIYRPPFYISSFLYGIWLSSEQVWETERDGKMDSFFVTWSWNSTAVRWSWGEASVCLQSSGLICSTCTSSVLSTLIICSREMQASLYNGKGKCTPWVRGQLTYINRSPHPWFLIGLSSC